jgi:hypothetical protein
MSILSSIETEFQAIVNDGRSVAEKLASLVDLHGRAKALEELEPQLVQLIESGLPSPEKVEQILKMVGKL